MNINPFAIQAPDSVESVLENASASCLRFNHGRGLFVGHYMAAGRTDGAVAIWAVETKGLLRFLEGHVKMVTSLSWSPYNRFLASSSLDWNVILWDLSRRDGGERSHTIRFDAPVASVQFSPVSSKQLLVVLQSQQLILTRLQRRRRRRPHTSETGRNGNVSGSSHLSSADFMVTEARSEFRPDAPEGLASELSSSFSGSIISAAFTPSGEVIVAGTSKGDILAFDVITCQLIQRVSSGSSGVRELAFDRPGRTLVANVNDRSIRLYSFQARRTERNEVDVAITAHHRFQDLVNRTPWSGIGFSGDAEYVFGGAIHKAAHNIYIWDRGAGVLDKILQGPRDSLITCDWHPSRPMLASVSHTGAINLWFTSPTEIWSAYAPGFEELEENVVYEEREDEFDLEDEEEVTRRKQDEEGAHVDIVSFGPQHSKAGPAPAAAPQAEQTSSALHADAATATPLVRKEASSAEDDPASDTPMPPRPQRQANGPQQASMGDDERAARSEIETTVDGQMAHDENSDTVSEEDESFAIPVRLSLDLPDLEGDE